MTKSKRSSYKKKLHKRNNKNKNKQNTKSSTTNNNDHSPDSWVTETNNFISQRNISNAVESARRSAKYRDVNQQEALELYKISTNIELSGTSISINGTPSSLSTLTLFYFLSWKGYTIGRKGRNRKTSSRFSETGF